MTTNFQNLTPILRSTRSKRLPTDGGFTSYNEEDDQLNRSTDQLDDIDNDYGTASNQGGATNYENSEDDLA